MGHFKKAQTYLHCGANNWSIYRETTLILSSYIPPEREVFLGKGFSLGDTDKKMGLRIFGVSF